MTMPTVEAPDTAALLARMRTFADELVDPMLCRSPAYGAPGFAHCAACCYGTGVVITCEEEQAVLDAAKALHHAADLIERAEGTGGNRDA